VHFCARFSVSVAHEQLIDVRPIHRFAEKNIACQPAYSDNLAVFSDSSDFGTVTTE